MPFSLFKRTLERINNPASNLFSSISNSFSSRFSNNQSNQQVVSQPQQGFSSSFDAIRRRQDTGVTQSTSQLPVTQNPIQTVPTSVSSGARGGSATFSQIPDTQVGNYSPINQGIYNNLFNGTQNQNRPVYGVSDEINALRNRNQPQTQNQFQDAEVSISSEFPVTQEVAQFQAPQTPQSLNRKIAAYASVFPNSQEIIREFSSLSSQELDTINSETGLTGLQEEFTGLPDYDFAKSYADLSEASGLNDLRTDIKTFRDEISTLEENRQVALDYYGETTLSSGSFLNKRLSEINDRFDRAVTAKTNTLNTTLELLNDGEGRISNVLNNEFRSQTANRQQLQNQISLVQGIADRSAETSINQRVRDVNNELLNSDNRTVRVGSKLYSYDTSSQSFNEINSTSTETGIPQELSNFVANTASSEADIQRELLKPQYDGIPNTTKKRIVSSFQLGEPSYIRYIANSVLRGENDIPKLGQILNKLKDFREEIEDKIKDDEDIKISGKTLDNNQVLELLSLLRSYENFNVTDETGLANNRFFSSLNQQRIRSGGQPLFGVTNSE